MTDNVPAGLMTQGECEMGFQPADVVDFARGILRMDGVTGVWLLAAPDDKAARMWVALAGFDQQAHERRQAVYESVEDFIAKHETAMHLSGFVFDYHVAIDEADLGPIQIPSGAVAVSAAA